MSSDPSFRYVDGGDQELLAVYDCHIGAVALRAAHREPGGDLGLLAAAAAGHLRGDELQFQLCVRHVRVIADQAPAERQRLRNHLAQRPHLYPNHVDATAGGVGFDHPGDRPAQRQLMHVRYRTDPAVAPGRLCDDR